MTASPTKGAKSYTVDFTTVSTVGLESSPVATALALSRDDLTVRARRLAEAIGTDLGEAVESWAAVGGGGAPDVRLPSAAVALPVDLARPLRAGDPPVIGHVERDRLLLDLIAVPPEQDTALADAVRRAAKD